MTEATPPHAAVLDQPMHFRRLIDEAASLSRQHFRALFLPIALPIAGMQVIMATGQVTAMRQIGNLTGSLSEGDPSAVMPLLGVTCLVAIVVMVLYGLAVAAMLSGTANATAGRQISFASHWGHAFKPRVAGTVLLLGFLISLGWLCCLVPGMAMAALWGFTLTATVEDGRFGIEAMRRSWHLSGYNPQGRISTSPRFKTFVLLIITWVLSALVSLFLQLPLQLLQQFLVTREALDGAPEAAFTSKWLWLTVPNTMMASFGSSAVLLYAGFGLSLLYWDVRRRAEGGDLEAELDALDVPQFHSGSSPESVQLPASDPEPPLPLQPSPYQPPPVPPTEASGPDDPEE